MTGSSKNREPNRFVVVRERAQVAAIAALGPQARWVAEAAAVVVIVQTERHEYDAGRCAQNMMVVAWADGVGSCPAHVDEGKLGALLGVPPACTSTACSPSATSIRRGRAFPGAWRAAAARSTS
jgi:nitroreductase